MNTTKEIFTAQRKINFSSFCLTLILGFVLATSIFAQTTEFTYQGKLSVTGTQTATYDFEFYLCASATDCAMPLSSLLRPNVTVTNGIFTVALDFGGGGFDAADKFLEIRVKRPTETNYTPLLPRQKITAAPLAIRAAEATIAYDSIALGGTNASEFVQTTDPRLNANNYVQNTTTAQPNVNFNIGGTGTAGVLNAGTQFEIGNNRILSNAGANNLFAGVNSGLQNTGDRNAFFGAGSGEFNGGGYKNSFFGYLAGRSNVAGNSNSFFGDEAGRNNGFGSSNSFFGSGAGLANTTGSNNTGIGAGANVGGSNLMFATAIGAGATVSANNTLVLGRSNDTVQTPGALNVGGSVNAALYKFGGSTIISNGGDVRNTYIGIESHCPSANGNDATANTFVGNGTGWVCTTGRANTVIGYGAGKVGAGDNNVIIGYGARVADGLLVNNSTAIGNFATVSTSHTIVLGSSSERTLIPGNLKVAANNVTSMETTTSHNSNYGPGVAIRTLYLGSPPLIYLNADLCFHADVAQNGYAVVGSCVNNNAASSLKTDAKPFLGGLNIVKRLKPMSFKWKEHDSTGIGLNSDEVAAVDSQLVARDGKGEISKVNESSLNAVLINAVKEQQAQIERQQLEINELRRQQRQFDELKAIVCALKTDAAVCKQTNK